MVWFSFCRDYDRVDTRNVQSRPVETCMCLTVDFDLLFVTAGIANDHIHGHRAAAN